MRNKKKDEASERCCLLCQHFHNDPAYIEKVYKGLGTLGSGYGSVRREDGICEYHELYLAADQWCGDFTPLQVQVAYA